MSFFEKVRGVFSSKEEKPVENKSKQRLAQIVDVQERDPMNDPLI